MSAPGMRLRALASRVCRPETMERLIDPIVADLQLEHANAAHRGRWRRGLIRCHGYFAFWSTAVSYSRVVLGVNVRKVIVNDDWAGGRFLGIAALIGTVVMVIMMFFPLMTGLSIVREHAGPGVNLGRALPLLIPQAVPIAIPAGLLCGILFGIGGRPVAVLVRRTILLMALLGSLFSFVMLDSVVPNTNQAFRIAVFQRPGDSRPLGRGANELTLRELSVRLIALKPSGASREMRMLRLSYHEHVALSLTPLVFGLMGLGLVGRIRKQRMVIGLAAVTLFSSYFVLFPFYDLVGDRAISPVIVAWMPNVVALLVTMACSAQARWHRESAG